MIDTHCHLFREDYENIEEVIKKMGNNIMIVAGTNAATNREVLELCHQYPNVYGTLGLHPEELSTVLEEDFTFIEQNLLDSKIVAIGEIGLDYHYEEDKKEKQKEIFIRQIRLAKKYHKTIVVHSRDAINDTYDILKEYGQGLKKVLHCYSSSYEMAKKFLLLDCKFGIGGTLTFKNNVKTVDMVEKLPLTSLLLETDSPYLTPEPNRGKKNEPYNIVYVANKIAAIKQIPVKMVIETTTGNALHQFDLDIQL